MSQPGYAMQNEVAVNSLISFNNPFELLTWCHPAAEFILIMGSVLAFVHACRHYKQTGDVWLICAWIAIIVHAIFWEITVFSFEEYTTNFWHGEFSIMLYHNRLPFYIVFGYYPALFYHAIIMAQRLGIPDNRYQRWITALLTGLIFEILYTACESISPTTQFWKWNFDHIGNVPLWSNIPANSYFWGLSYGFAYYWLSQKFFVDFLKHRKTSIPLLAGLIALVAVLIPVIGMLLMMPINVLVQGFNMVSAAGLYIWLNFVAAFWILFTIRKQYPKKPDWLMFWFPAIWVTFLITAYFSLYDVLVSPERGAQFTVHSTAAGNLWVGAAGIVGTLILIHLTQFKGRNRP